MTHRCPICRRTTDFSAHTSRTTNLDFPFCSERCRLLDLGRWAAERYRVSYESYDSEPAPAGTEFQELSELDDQHAADFESR